MAVPSAGNRDAREKADAQGGASAELGECTHVQPGFVGGSPLAPLALPRPRASAAAATDDDSGPLAPLPLR